jgi:hypothetical protein
MTLRHVLTSHRKCIDLALDGWWLVQEAELEVLGAWSAWRKKDADATTESMTRTRVDNAGPRAGKDGYEVIISDLTVTANGPIISK